MTQRNVIAASWNKLITLWKPGIMPYNGHHRLFFTSKVQRGFSNDLLNATSFPCMVKHDLKQNEKQIYILNWTNLKANRDDGLSGVSIKTDGRSFTAEDNVGGGGDKPVSNGVHRTQNTDTCKYPTGTVSGIQAIQEKTTTKVFGEV